jgi:hypothetical protein
MSASPLLGLLGTILSALVNPIPLQLGQRVTSFPKGGTGGIFSSNEPSWGSAVQTVVPEPATMLLLGSGFIVLAGYGKKKLLKK